MRNQKRVLWVFISIILFFFIYGLVHDYLYDYRVNISSAINLPKTEFVDLAFPNRSIINRELDMGENTSRYYKYNFQRASVAALLAGREEDKNYIYLMIEKPDAQYLEIELNGILLDVYGEKDGNSNLWNGIFYTKIDTEYLQDHNNLVITMMSDYMTGVIGQILFINENDYRTLNIITSFSERILDDAVIIAFFASVVLLIMLIAWKEQLYNRMTYFYFLLSILALGISLMDSQKVSYLLTSYLVFKKIIVIAYHSAATFAALGVSTLFNSKHKWSFGMVGLFLSFLASVLSSDMITFRSYYVWTNYFLILALVQIVVTIIVYRKRAIVSSSLLLIGFTLMGMITLKLVVITNYVMSSSSLIDVPLIIVIYITMVLFLFYIEMLQIVVDYDIAVVEDRNQLGITNHMQGSFTIGSNLCVTGAYATACDHIFNRRIMGVSIMELLANNKADYDVVEGALESIFDDGFDFKEGFLALLPESIELEGRVYQLNYSLVEHAATYLRVTLSDVTRSVELEHQLEEERKHQQLIINALKSQQEISYFIERVRVFINRLRINGFTTYYKSELHAIKGNAGQYGFHQFEKKIHLVEDALLEENYDKADLCDQLENSFNDSVALLEAQIGDQYFEDSYDHLIVSKESVYLLEKTFDEANYDRAKLENFSKQLKRLSYINLKDRFHHYRDYIDRLARDTEKSILPFEVAGDAIKVNPEKAENISRTLVAIIRNAVVHGIENAETRVNLGKDSYGRIYCTLTKVGDTVEIILGDDGAGINRTFLVNKAVQYGILTKIEANQMTEEDKLNLIFESGMSRLEDMDILAGRGLGLYSVKETIEAMKGRVEVGSLLGRGTEFKLILPLEALWD